MSTAHRFCILLMTLWLVPASAQTDYGLRPKLVADGVYVFEGRLEHFSRENGGNIVNTGYLETAAGAVVIDTGPSLRYGQQQRTATLKGPMRGIARVYNTHAHPDHFLGNAAYTMAKIQALPATRATIAELGDTLAENLYRMVGDWMAGTQPVVPAADVDGGEVTIGGRHLRLIALSGHTDGDLAVYDEATATLFAGDLVFFRRTPTTPNADLDHWLQSLDTLQKLPYRNLVPGHGPVVHDARAIDQTRDYLNWLRQTLGAAALRGQDMSELLDMPLPERFGDMAVFHQEFARSVSHLYAAEEQRALKAVNNR